MKCAKRGCNQIQPLFLYYTYPTVLKHNFPSIESKYLNKKIKVQNHYIHFITNMSYIYVI